MVETNHSEPNEIEFLKDLSLEELMNITVTSVSKKPETFSTAPAAVFIITQEDIRRSGARTLPDVFRMVPGLSVAKLDGNKWAISARGFNDRLANKLLVLLDGRSIYTTLFGGVFWESHDVLLNDIERIEVIRGPGATLYGANAVNGVINIITKNAKDTQGTEVSMGSGTEEQGFGHVRHGGKIGSDSHYRAYAKFADRDSQKLKTGADAPDDWQSFRSGFRFDIDADEQNNLTIIGDAYQSNAGVLFQSPQIDPPSNITQPFEEQLWGANLLTRWDHVVSATEDWSVQLFYDRNERDSWAFDDRRDTFDIELKHHLHPLENHEVVWGGGYRFVGDHLRSTFQVSFSPNERENHIFNAFVQDKITLINDRLSLILGSKFEHNEYTGFEVQPNARLVWTPHDQHVFWSSISRAVRTPSRAEQDGRIVLPTIGTNHPQNRLPIPVSATLIGSRNFDSEVLWAYEIGYRFLPVDWAFLDATLFYNDYDDLLNAGAGEATIQTIGGNSFLNLPLLFNNSMTGETYGAELAADFQFTPKWKVRTAYTFFDIQLHSPPGSFLNVFEEFEHRSPNHQLSIFSQYDVTDKIELDIWGRYVSALDDTFQFPPQQFLVPDYLALDIRLGWNPNENVEITFGLQNVLDSQRPEMSETIVSTVRTEVERSAYLQTTWRF